MTAKMKMDELFIQITDYIFDTPITSLLGFETAYIALLDSLGCAALALQVPLCRQLLGPMIPGSKVPLGARVPGTPFELDPVKAAFDIGTCIRWLDYNDTWLAKEWGHPSDNLGALLAVGDYLSRGSLQAGTTPLKIKDLLEGMIKAYEIQGILALDNAFNQVGLDHVILVKLASSAIVAKWWGLSKSQTCDVLSHVFMDGASLRSYRHAPNTGPRKSWAAGDATARAVFLVWLVKQGQTGYPTALSSEHWGFCDVLFKGKPIILSKPLGSYVMENVLFKVAFPAEFHAQTAVECAIHLHPSIIHRIEEIERIEITTHASAMRIINKTGPLHNYADRDHCLQYMVAIGLIYGNLQALHYSDIAAKDPRIDILRSKTIVHENPQFSLDYLDPEKRSIANSVQVFFKDGSFTENVSIEYPLGHKRRRKEVQALLQQKYTQAISSLYEGEQQKVLLQFWQTPEQVIDYSISDFVSAFTFETKF